MNLLKIARLKKSRIKALCRFQRQKAKKHRTATPSGLKSFISKLVLRDAL